MRIRVRQTVPSWQCIVVGIAALMMGVWSLFNNPEHNDMIGALIRPNLSVLVPQSLLLMFMMWQVLTYRSIASLIQIRQQTELIQKRLLIVVVSEVTLYFLIYYAMFGFSGITPFIDGSPVIGTLILALRYLMMLILGIMIVGAYHVRRPSSLVILALLINIGYHYWIEVDHLLIMYSPLYDPLYRALHHIYRG